MNRSQAKRSLRRLAARFRVSQPDLIWVHRNKRGQAHFDQWAIEIGPGLGGFDAKAQLAHEFAHMIAAIGHGDYGHGEAFYRCLSQVVNCLYPTGGYPWNKELAQSGPKESMK